MGLFKKKEYIEEVLPEISSSEKTLVVIIKNMQCKRETTTSTRKYPYPDFGSEFNEELIGKHKVNYKDVKEALERGDKFFINFRLRQLPEMSLEIRGTLPTKESNFDSDFFDAVINAFEQNNIKP